MSWLLLSVLACAKDPVPTEAPAAEPVAAAPDRGGESDRVRDGRAEVGSGAAPSPGGPPSFGGNIDVAADPAAAYEVYRERLEGPEADGECSTDADCAKAGCSSEVCAPASAAASISTTCEVLPVFAILDSCGCVESRCSWSIKE